MNVIYPKDSETRKVGSKGRQIVHSAFDAERWEYRELTGVDVGTDAEIEYSHDGEFRNEKFICQIKTTKNINTLKSGLHIAFGSFPVKTYRYALNLMVPFYFLLVDVLNEKVYFLRISKDLLPRCCISENHRTLTLHIPIVNCVQTNEEKLISELLDFYRQRMND